MTISSLVFTVLALYPSVGAHADLVASPNETRPGGGTVASPGGLRDINHCAESVSTGWFSQSGQPLVTWQAQEGFVKPIMHPPVATSIYVDRGLDLSHAPGFITINEGQVLYTPAVIMTPRKNAAWAAKQTTLTLDLKNQFDAQRGLPVVDTRDSISPSWAQELTWSHGDNNPGHPRTTFTLAEAEGAVTPIKSSDALTGESARVALRRIEEILRARVSALPAQAIDTFRTRTQLRSAKYRSGGRPRQPSEFYLTTADLDQIRKGLCGCEGQFEEVERARKEILKPDSPVRIYDADGPRRILPTDVSCTMV